MTITRAIIPVLYTFTACKLISSLKSEKLSNQKNAVSFHLSLSPYPANFWFDHWAKSFFYLVMFAVHVCRLWKMLASILGPHAQWPGKWIVPIVSHRQKEWMAKMHLEYAVNRTVLSCKTVAVFVCCGIEIKWARTMRKWAKWQKISKF